jgi:hypothetical protein
MNIDLHVKNRFFLSYFNESWIFSKVFRKILKHKISWKCVQWEPSCSMQTDRQTEATNLIVAFRNFASAPKNQIWDKITIRLSYMEPSAKPSSGVPRKRQHVLHRRAHSTRPCCFDGVNVSRLFPAHTHEQYSRSVGRSVGWLPFPKTIMWHFRRTGTAKYVRLNAFHSPSIITELFLSSTPSTASPLSPVRPSVGFRWRPERHANLFSVSVTSACSTVSELNCMKPWGPNPPSL